MTALLEAPSDALRLLPQPPATSLVDHLARFGPLPPHRGELIGEAARAGLRGRGGANFPTATKLTAVQHAVNASRRRGVVVANGTEGEPASDKDKTLLVFAPHLVLDGIVAAALAVGADEGVVCVDRAAVPALGAIERARMERHDPIKVRVAATPDRYVTGEETALVNWLNGGDAKPTFTPPRPFQQGVGFRPTLVDNVETLAQLAVIARVGGGQWAEAGMRLVTVGGACERPGVYELRSGTPLDMVLRHAGAHLPAGILVGGYFGTWLTPAEAETARLDASIVSVVGEGVCPLEELARVARWLASQSAGQCGPCALGLPAIASAVAHIADTGDADGRARTATDRWTEMVKGRGACKLPDGAARFVQTGLRVFAAHVAEHRAHGSCLAKGAPAVLPVPVPEASWR
jgi:NADH:ubiquinone oxidoreductase subunit F (NADH-binding)